MVPYLNMLGWIVIQAATWLVVVFCLCGWGLLAPCLSSPPKSFGALLRAFWFGFVLTVVYLQLLHLFLPIGQTALIIWGAAGVLGWVRAGGQPWRMMIGYCIRYPWLIALTAFVTLLFSGYALGPADLYDTGLYHLQAVRWNQAFPIAPGLGNLHTRLAFNNSCFLLQAMSLRGIWKEAGHGFVNGLLGLALAVEAGVSAYRLATRRSSVVMPDIVGMLMLFPVLAMAFRSGSPTWFHPLSSVSSDVSAALVQLAAVNYASRFFSSRPADPAASSSDDDGGTSQEYLMLAAALAVVAACFKLSSAPFAGTLVLGMLLRFIRSSTSDTSAWRSSVCKVLVLMALLVVPWVVRGIILSGYSTFPLRVAAVNVPWRVPTDAADSTRESIKNWARKPGHIPGQPWLASWLIGAWRTDIAAFTLPVAVALLGFMVTALRSSKSPNRGGLTWIIMASVAGLIAWFVAAPDRRFAFPLFYTVAICAVATAVQSSRPRTAYYRVAWFLVVAMLVVVVSRVGLLRRATGVSIPILVAATTLPLPMSQGGHFVMPAVDVRQIESESGLVIYIPVQGDQAWDAPLPSAPAPFNGSIDLRSLDLRREHVLGSGFVLREPASDASDRDSLEPESP